jgi:alkylation response protein AidB-like acyl-CoA dehydrogenase
MRQFVEKAGIPFYTTPQGRGVVPDDHPNSYLTMRSTAFRDADLIIILGTRMNYVIGHAAPPRFGANAKIARHILVVCRTTKGDDKHQGLSMIWIPTDALGLQIDPIDTLGGRETAQLYLDEVEAPESALLGEVDQGWTQLMAGLNVERLILAATMLGIGQRAFDDALAYVKERHQFGRPIGSFQALQHRLADLATELEAARLMTHWVASKVDEDPDRMLPREASMVKLFVTETAQKASLEGMQMMGGYGYSSEYDMERLVRQTLVSTIYGGTSEIQRNIIAKTLGL